LINKYNKESLVFFLHAFLHQKLVFLANIVSCSDAFLDELEKVQRADGTLRCGLKTGLDAGGVEEVEAENGGYFVSGFDVIVADGTLADLALVLRFDEVGPVLFDGFAVLFELDLAQVGLSSLVGQQAVSEAKRVLADDPRDVVVDSLVTVQLKLDVCQIKDVAAAIDLAGHPTFFDFYVVFVALDVDPACTIIDFDPVATAQYGEIEG
jgi:hypothetical protein